MSPVVERMRSLGTTRWMPFDARTSSRAHRSALGSSVHTPVALTTRPRPDLVLVAALDVGHPRPDDPLALSRRNPTTRARLADVRAVGGGGPRDGTVPRVVDLGVVVLQRADQGVLLERRARSAGTPPGQVPVRGQPAVVAGGAWPACRTARRRPRVAPLPPAVCCSG